MVGPFFWLPNVRSPFQKFLQFGAKPNQFPPSVNRDFPSEQTQPFYEPPKWAGFSSENRSPKNSPLNRGPLGIYSQISLHRNAPFGEGFPIKEGKRAPLFSPPRNFRQTRASHTRVKRARACLPREAVFLITRRGGGPSVSYTGGGGPPARDQKTQHPPQAAVSTERST